MGMGNNVALSILDLSETGIRMIMNESFEKDHEVEVNLQSNTSQRTVKHQGTVVWSVPASDGTYCIGVVFRRPLAYADFTQFTVV
jgi:PilZ domain